MMRPENHLINRVGWLRAAVLGANDGLISTASLMVGVAAAAASTQQVLLAGVAGLVAGAMAMATGEYVSVSSQRDTEVADLEKEKRELKADPEGEMAELAAIYVSRGLSPQLAGQVAEEFTRADALGTHARDELGLTLTMAANPLQAAVTSSLAFALGAALPLIVAIFSPLNSLVLLVSGATLVALAILGAAGAMLGGAGIAKPAMRVLFWGAMALASTALIGKLFGVATG